MQDPLPLHGVTRLPRNSYCFRQRRANLVVAKEGQTLPGEKCPQSTKGGRKAGHRREPREPRAAKYLLRAKRDDGIY